MEPQIQPGGTVSYKEILKEIGHQLALRKKDLIKRILLLSWPVAILAGLLFITDKNGALKDFISSDPKLFFIIAALVIAFIIPYYYVISFLIRIEKHLWIDSTFDKRTMDSKTSWRIAWKLFFPVIGLTLQVILRYYIPSIIVIIVGFLSLSFLASHTSLIDMIGGWVVIVCIALVLLVGVYFYFLKIYLRFITFLFIDRYNKTAFTYSALFREMCELNKISKSDNFKKALVVTFGTDALATISHLVLDIIQAGLNSLGNVGGFVGAVARPVAQETVRQVKSFSQLTAIYLLYIQARSMANPDKPHEVNEYIYTL